MYTLKIVRAGNYEDEVGIVKEELVYHEIGADSEILLYKANSEKDPVAKVIGDNKEILVYAEESAYLINEHGRTLQIINRVQ